MAPAAVARRLSRTLKAPAHTAVMGSSLGGICSLAIAWEYPRVFCAAASLSGSFQIEKRQFLETVLQPYRRQPKPFRIYLDSGRIDHRSDRIVGMLIFLVLMTHVPGITLWLSNLLMP